MLLVLLAVFGISLARGQGELEARTLAFTTLMVANLGLMLTNRSWSATLRETLRAPNTALWWVTGGALVFLGLVLTVSELRSLFRFSVLHGVDVLVCLAAGSFSIAWFELFKVRVARRLRNGVQNAAGATSKVPGLGSGTRC